MRNATIGTLSLAIAFVFGSPGLSTSALAQESEAGELEEIFVTARKRTESLEEIPVAVSAFGSDELFKRGARNLIDVAKFTPGFQFNEQGVQEPGRLYTSLRFRGLGSEIKEPFGQVGSAFLDGVYMSSGVSSLGNENLERVEIIKGPAASWLGRSTFAGAINLITKTPSLEEYSGRVTADYRQDQTYDLSFAHEGPIIKDKLAYRIFVRGYGTDGQYSNSSGAPLGEETTDTIMGTLYAEPTDGLSVRFRALWSKDEDGLPAQLYISGPLGLRGQNNTGLTNCFEKNPEWTTLTKRNDGVSPLTDFVCGEIPKALNLVGGNTELQPDFFKFWEEVVPQIGGIPSLRHTGLKREQTRLALSVDYELPIEGGFFEGTTLSLLIGNDEEDVISIRDFDYTEAANWQSRDPQVIETEQYEFRITSGQEQKFTWMLGFSFFEADFNSQFSGGEVIVGTDAGITSTGFGFFDLDSALGRPIDEICPCVFPPFDFPPRTSGETTGIFGSLGYQFTDAWSVDFEWRYQEDDISGFTSASGTFLDPTAPGFPVYGDFLCSDIGELCADFDAFLPRVIMQYRPSDATNIWASYAEGNNPGYFNLDLVTRPQAEIAAALAVNPNTKAFIDEEDLTNYELGWKQRFWEDRISFTVVGYFIEWENQKTREGVPATRADGSQFIVNSVVSGFSTDIFGIELEGVAAFTENLSMDYSVNWADAEFQDFNCGFADDFAPADPDGIVRCDGNRPVQYPEWSGSFGIDWVDSFNADWDYFARFDGSYTGKRFADEKNFSYIGDYWLFNLRAGFQRDNLRIEAFVANLFDEDQYLAGNRWTDFSSSRDNIFPFEFGLQQGIVLTPPKKRQLGVRVAFDF
jgi:iron complex outermembrane receptor protein